MNKKGFTLIELLVVVLIIGILAAIALPQYFKAVEKSRSTEALSIMGSLAGAMERGRLVDNNANYPASLGGLDLTFTNSDGTAATATSIQTKNFNIVITGGTEASGKIVATRNGSNAYKIQRMILSGAVTCQNGTTSGVCESLGLTVGTIN
jgi:prepilin-type N-terminal cleavage/methylation domain-containing protein